MLVSGLREFFVVFASCLFLGSPGLACDPCVGKVPGLDPSFGACGEAESMFDRDHAADGVALDEDGAIMVSGWHGYCDPFLARYTADGLADSTFGEGGGSVVSLGTPTEMVFNRPIVILANGQILVASQIDGHYNDAYPNDEDPTVMFRVNGDGSMDTSFGIDGLAAFEQSDKDWRVQSLHASSDGQAVVLGDDGQWSRNTLLLGVSSDGSPDPDFGELGVSILPTTGSGYDAVRTTDGELVVATGSYKVEGETPQDFALARVDTEGHLDPTFGEGGVAAVTTAYSGQLNGIAEQSDGKLLAIGGYSNDEWDPFSYSLVMRFDADGQLDTAYGDDGIVYLDPGTECWSSSYIAVDSEGRAIVFGKQWNSDDTDEAWTVTRLTTDGSLDRTFGVGGIYRITPETDYDQVGGAVLQPDDKLIVVGHRGQGNIDATMFVHRYIL